MDRNIRIKVESNLMLGHKHLALRSVSPAGLPAGREPTHSVSQSSVKYCDFLGGARSARENFRFWPPKVGK